MPTDDDIEAALITALMPLAATLGARAIEREELEQLNSRRLEMRGSDLCLAFYFAAHRHEIEPSITVLTPAGPKALPLENVQRWLGETVEAHMFNETNLGATCRRVADFSRRVIDRYRNDPAAALSRIDAITSERTGEFRINEVRRAAEAAWEERDLAEAERLYGEIAQHLTAAERKRLAFARKK